MEAGDVIKTRTWRVSFGAYANTTPLVLHRVVSLCLGYSMFLTISGNYFLRDGYVNNLDFLLRVVLII